MIAFQEKQSLFRVAMQTLFYPAVLGSIIYSVFGNFENIDELKGHLALVIIMLSIITFFCIDFLTTYLKSVYSSIGVISDVTVISLMYAAFESINFIKYPSVRLDIFCLCMSATFLLFVIVDSFHRSAYKNYFVRIIVFEIFLVISYGVFSFITFPGEEWWIAGLSSVTATTMVIVFSKMYRSNYSGMVPSFVANRSVASVTELLPHNFPGGPARRDGRFLRR